MTRTMLTTQLFAAAAMLLVTVGAPPAAAQTFDAAVEAYERGDYATALAGFQNYAEQGNAAAQSNLGLMYANGKGVPKDAAEAVQWYRLAAEQGHAFAQLSLGVMYANGEGGPLVTLGLDGYSTRISAAEVEAHDWVLATRTDGRALGIGERGPLWLVFDPLGERPATKDESSMWPWAVFLIQCE